MDHLESAVRAGWEREAIAVYGDYLMSIGDPRGELVAMDLRIDEEGASPEVRARRAELIAAWFGDQLPPGMVRYGFVDVDASGVASYDQIIAALRGPGAAFVRSVVLAGEPDAIARSLQLIVAEPRPWLTRLCVRQWDESAVPTIGNAACGLLAAVAPHLSVLEVEGRRVFAELVPASLNALIISGFDAMASLIGETTHAFAASSLDFAFHCHFAREHDPPSAEVLRTLISAGRFPNLTALDLSRNGPGRLAPVTLGGNLDVCSFVDNLALRARLEHLTMPALLSGRDQEKLQHALDGMPALKALRVFGKPWALKHETAQIDFVVR